MAVLKEVVSALEWVAKAIDNVRKISEAIRTGKNYVRQQHPDVSADLAGMCEQMRNSMFALAAGSSLLTHFCFVIGDAVSAEATRFNEHMIRHKELAERLRQQIHAMRGHCSVIRKHADQILVSATSRSIKNIFSVLGSQQQSRDLELWSALQDIYNEELDFDRSVNAMAMAVDTALTDVQASMGAKGTIDPAKVPAAAELLGEYSAMFEPLERQCNFTALELQSSVDALLR